MKPLVFALFALVRCTLAYIPAVPTNNTNAVNQSDMSMLYMKWAPQGTYSNTVSFQLASNGSQGFAQGALVHFSEKGLTNQNASTPWIAFVNCDTNTTGASQQDDIFTLARDRGAVAALLYSLTSEACLINPEYASPENFEQILDIFATQSKFSATIIKSQFSNLHNASFGDYDPAQLNSSAASVMASLRSDNITSSFIVATLRSSNSTISLNGTSTAGSDPNNNNNSRSNPNTGLAMIILYAITGCVSTLFIIVILSGAIRAIRHPERYGPRAGTGDGGPDGMGLQSRTRGLGRAILDTFPVIKFGQNAGGEVTSNNKQVDLEDQSQHIPMNVIEKSIRSHTETSSAGQGSEAELMDAAPSESSGSERHSAAAGEVQAPLSSTAAVPLLTSPQSSDAAARDTTGVSPESDDVRPDSIGHETCPICIVDFEEGDDLRVLPCEGKHKFHQTCVDPWLLDLSSSCPLCREDFHALESMMAESVTDAPTFDTVETEGSSTTTTSRQRSPRFVKYLNFVRRRNRGTEVAPGGQIVDHRP